MLASRNSSQLQHRSFENAASEPHTRCKKYYFRTLRDASHPTWQKFRRTKAVDEQTRSRIAGQSWEQWALQWLQRACGWAPRGCTAGLDAPLAQNPEPQKPEPQKPDPRSALVKRSKALTLKSKSYGEWLSTALGVKKPSKLGGNSDLWNGRLSRTALEQEESWDVGLAAPRSVKSKICLELAHLHVKRSWQQLL
jgi:hypothetical protein